MADVRSLLRNERASRRITHPAASYTESGKLLCNICVIQIKTESLWDNHTKSPQHILRIQQARESQSQGKKRKAGDEEDEGRKRVKGVPEGFADEAGPERDSTYGDENVGPEIDDFIAENNEATAQGFVSQRTAATSIQNVDEDEWAAFERDIAVAQAPPVPITAAATISAAPMSAEEIAAQAREEQSTQRDRRQAEIEAENEEAEQALLDEFDEMEELEDRVRRLREKREALRKAREGVDEVLPDVTDQASTAPTNLSVLAQENDDDDDDEEDDDDFDDWRFGAN